MKPSTVKNKVLMVEQLKKTPIVQIACEKVGVARATYYHWRKHDETFARASDEAIRDGARLVNDMAESQLLAAIREGNMRGIIFWLKHHHPDFASRVEVTARHQHSIDELTAEQQAVVAEALRLSALPTDSKDSRDES